MAEAHGRSLKLCESADDLILGVDLGGSKILTAVVKSRGEILSSDESTTPATEDREVVIQSILDSAHSALGQANCTISEISAIGIGAPGISNPEAGILFTSPNLPRGIRNFIYITLSTGIGGGIIIDGKIYTGAIGTAGEVGHMTIDDKGPICNCGNRGCWETLASGTALARARVMWKR